MPAELRKLVEKSARINRRSLNAELVMRLQNSVERDPVFIPDIAEDSGDYAPSGDQSAMIRLYNRLSMRRRKVLLEFLKEFEVSERRK